MKPAILRATLLGMALSLFTWHRIRAEDLPRYQPSRAALAAAYAKAEKRPNERIFKGRITPHWSADGEKFWYRNDLRDGSKEFVLVDPEKATRETAFDHGRLAESLNNAAGTEYLPSQLPFDEIEFTDSLRDVRFYIGKIHWSCQLNDYSCSQITQASEERPIPKAKASRKSNNRSDIPEPKSPDGKWTAEIRGDNLFIRDTTGNFRQLTTDGLPGRGYILPSWSPDSTLLAAFLLKPGDEAEVYRIESSPKKGGRAVLHHNPYALPGDKLTQFSLKLFDLTSGNEVRHKDGPIELEEPHIRWSADSQTLTFSKVDRGHQRFRLVELAAKTGESRNLIDEKSDTFIWTTHTEDSGVSTVTWLRETDEFIYASEKSGWRHLYLVDTKSGHQTPLTAGEWVVRGIDRIDEECRQLWFSAGGLDAKQDPYFLHHFLVNFDGSNLVDLTPENGTHTVQVSPDGKYLIDTYSRVDLPPIHELRRASDGSLICRLDVADAGDITGPETFVAKGRDGTTDIWGVIYRPANFDPAKQYPVIEDIYAGPQGAFVPKGFSPAQSQRHLTELGFVVVQIDGMGTALRSKAFHDVCWQNLKDGGFPDRILWHHAAAAMYPWYDVTRVGIFGTSAGGQNAAGAVLFHGDFYKAAVAACGCHDNRMDKASWNEQWMGYPVGPHYAACSNIENAHRLRGKLLLIVGELDDNVPPESTFRFCHALNKAGKDYELLLVPGMGHSDGGKYGRRRLQDFFVRHLHGLEPPDHNSGAASN